MSCASRVHVSMNYTCWQRWNRRETSGTAVKQAEQWLWKWPGQAGVGSSPVSSPPITLSLSVASHVFPPYSWSQYICSHFHGEQWPRTQRVYHFGKETVSYAALPRPLTVIPDTGENTCVVAVALTPRRIYTMSYTVVLPVVFSPCTTVDAFGYTARHKT